MAQKIFGADQNQVVLFNESGTYGTKFSTAIWPGLVTNHEVDEDMGVINLRYAGTSNRDVSQFIDGPTTYNGTMTMNPQNFRMFKFILGSCADGGSPAPYTHFVKGMNSDGAAPETGEAFPSFQIEDAHVYSGGQNLIRTVKGCMVDSATLTLSEGEASTLEINYVAQNLTFSSGAKSSVTADTSRPFMWKDFKVHLPSGTIPLPTAKEVSLTINNNMETPNYVDNSRDIGVPIPTNRDIEVAITLNADPNVTKVLYNQYFLGGSTFNFWLEGIASTGSREIRLVGSGCKMIDMSAPTPNEGINEQTLTINVQTITGSIVDNVFKYNAW